MASGGSSNGSGFFFLMGSELLSFFMTPARLTLVSGGYQLLCRRGIRIISTALSGYVPPAPGEGSGYFHRLYVCVDEKLFGRVGRQCAHGQRESQSTQELEASYNEPWLPVIPSTPE